MLNLKSQILLLCAVVLCACQPKQQTSFQYNVDKFYDLEILRYDVPEFDSLTLQQKQLIYCLSEAALWGRDILLSIIITARISSCRSLRKIGL